MKLRIEPTIQIPPPYNERAQQAALALETEFLSEMLKSAGVSKQQSDLGGGLGEAQYASLLARAQAEQLAAGGGIGLAKVFFDALQTSSDKNE